MKRSTWGRRLISLALAISLVLTVTGSTRAAKKSEMPASDEGDFVWIEEEDVGGSEVEAEQSPEIEEDYDAEEEVRVFIVLQGESVLEAGFSARDLSGNRAAENFSDETEEQQNIVIKRIQHALQQDLVEIRYQFSLLDNAVSAVVKYKDIEKIKDVDGVEDVHVVPEYKLTDTARPSTITAGEMVGSYQTWDSGYTGLGQRIAIVDTGIDEDHPSFDAGAFAYGRKQTEKANGHRISEDDLLGIKDIENVLGQLRISQNGEKPEPASLFRSDKIAFAYNYVDDNLDVSHKASGEHGTHVAGIAAANEYVPAEGNTYQRQSEGVAGVAKDAQLLIMKVVGENDTAYTDDYMAAIEDALILDADVINLSLGTMNPGESVASQAEEYVNGILARLLGSDVIVSVSAGNNGAWADASRYGRNRTEDVNMNMVGAPGSYADVLTVASAVNAGYSGCGFQIGKRTYFYRDAEGNDNILPMTTLDTKGTGTDYEYVFLETFGEENDYANIDVRGKIVFVSKGIISYAEKHENAQKAGALALFIYNDSYGYTKMNLSNSKAVIPCAMVGYEESWSLQGEDGGTLRIFSKPVKDSQTASGYRMSGFSAWGVPGDLKLKPEITAPGENIYSTLSGGGYGSMSGTSMAAPSIAGMSALVSEYIQRNGLAEKTGLSIRTLTQALLMSTAVPLKEEKGIEYSPRKQGSGLANVQAATTTPVYLLAGQKDGNDGKVKAELGDDADKRGIYEFDFSLYNMSDENQYFALDSSILTEQAVGGRIGKSSYKLKPNVTFSSKNQVLVYDLNGNQKVDEEDALELLRHINGSVFLERVEYRKENFDFNRDGVINTVDAYRFLKELDAEKPTVNLYERTLEVEDEAAVHVKVVLSQSDRQYLDTRFKNGMYIDGFVYLNGSVPLSLPILAFYGNWSESPMFDPFDYLAYHNGGEEAVQAPYAALEKTNYLNYYVAEEEKEYCYASNMYLEDGDAQYLPERNAFSSNSGDKISSAVYTLIRNAAVVHTSITDDKTGKVYYEHSEENVQGSYYDPQQRKWCCTDTSTLLDWQGTDQKGNPLPEGTTVNITITALPQYYKDKPHQAGAGVTFCVPITIDNTRPELSDIQEVSEENIRLIFKDNRYTAAVKIYDEDKETLLKSYAVNQTRKGISTQITMEDPAQIFYIKLIDYAGNVSSYRVDRSRKDLVTPDEGNLIQKTKLPLAAICLISGNVTEKAAQKASEDVIFTRLTAEGKTVTLQVNIAEDTLATSGRIKIYYPAELLQLSDAVGGMSFRVEDINYNLNEDGKKGISYAWADTEKLVDGGGILTVTMEALDSANGQEITVGTEVVELFSEEEPVLVKNKLLSDKLTLDFGQESSTDHEGNAAANAAGNAVRTGDDTQLAGYALLCMLVLLVMIEQVKKKLAG